jgi:NapC/NirT cytochrome c family protein
MNGLPPNRYSAIFRNWISLMGVVLAASAVFAFVLLLVMDFLAADQNPYLGILTYLVAPVFFAAGVLLMGIGRIVYRRRLARAGPDMPLPRLAIDLTRPRDRRYLGFFLGGSALFLLLTSVGSYQTYHVTKSVQFCGQACHTPMEPQYVSYQHSTHARVECTACHIGPGAANFVKAKFNGLHQVYQAAFGTYRRPIDGVTKVHIDQKTCEQCHWPEKYHGNLERTYSHFLTDEANPPYAVRLLLKVGGGDPTHGPAGGIHWHMNVANKVEYIALDPLRQKIPWVRFTDASGKVTEFRKADFKEDPARYPLHRMDCMDCHNRPAHQFRAPTDAVDLAMALGRIDPKLPGIKREAVLALTQTNLASADEAVQKIASALRGKYSGRPSLDSTIAEVQEIYRRNFFPAMKTDWRTHPNNIGHKDWPGCFRCHDGEHVALDRGLKIKADDCNACHILLAEGSGPQLEQLHAKGQPFKHPEEGWQELRCFDCHNGTVSK